MSKSLRAHASRLEKSAGECVTYTRGTESISVYAVPGESLHESIQPDGTVVEHKMQDFLIRKTALDFGSGAVEPDRKDEIVWVKDGVTRTFQVLPDAGFTSIREAMTNSPMYRIHTKEKPN